MPNQTSTISNRGHLCLNADKLDLFITRIQIRGASQPKLLTQPYDRSLIGLGF